MSCDGEVIANGMVGEADMPELMPQQECRLSLNFDVPAAGKCYLKISYYLKESNALVKAGSLLGFDEVLLENADMRNQKAAAL